MPCLQPLQRPPRRRGVALALAGSEIVRSQSGDVGRYEALLLCYGMLGFAFGCVSMDHGAGFCTGQAMVATWLVEHDIFWPLVD